MPPTLSYAEMTVQELRERAKKKKHGDRLGVLRLDFPGYGGDDLRHVSWEEWFRTFDERKLNVLYQEHKSDGQSNCFRLENPDREDP